jgi:hypothetical protein
MFVLLWSLIGIAAVSISYFLAATPGDLWQSVNAAGLTAAVYLFGLLLFTLRKPFSFTTRIIGWLVSIVVCVSIAYTWHTQDIQSHWQRRTLQSILQRINSGVLHARMHDSLLVQFRKYHTQDGQTKKSICVLFSESHPGILIGQNFYTPIEDWDSTRIYLRSLNDTLVEIVGRASHVKGINPVFQTIDNVQGQIQICATLTGKGIVYVREN